MYSGITAKYSPPWFEDIQTYLTMVSSVHLLVAKIFTQNENNYDFLMIQQVRRREGYSAAESYQQSLHKNVCLSGPSIMFGDLEHVSMTTCPQTITTLPDC